VSKQPLDWHRECRKNWAATLQEKRSLVARLRAELAQSEKGLLFYTKQIETAGDMGMASFDMERFLVKRQKAQRGG
jgi:hypothetical protein